MKVAIKGIFFKDEELFSKHQFKLKTLITQVTRLKPRLMHQDLRLEPNFKKLTLLYMIKANIHDCTTVQQRTKDTSMMCKQSFLIIPAPGPKYFVQEQESKPKA